MCINTTDNTIVLVLMLTFRLHVQVRFLDVDAGVPGLLSTPGGGSCGHGVT